MVRKRPPFSLKYIGLSPQTVWTVLCCDLAVSPPPCPPPDDNEKAKLMHMWCNLNYVTLMPFVETLIWYIWKTSMVCRNIHFQMRASDAWAGSHSKHPNQSPEPTTLSYKQPNLCKIKFYVQKKCPKWYKILYKWSQVAQNHLKLCTQSSTLTFPPWSPWECRTSWFGE